jgi:hypothetical protein
MTALGDWESWSSVSPTKRRAVGVQSHLRVTVAQGILKNL